MHTKTIEKKGHKAYETVRALSHKLRLKIIRFIHDNPGTTVGNIYRTMGLFQSETSQHLRVLREAGLVSTERDGHNVMYRINYSELERVLGVIKGKV